MLAFIQAYWLIWLAGFIAFAATGIVVNYRRFVSGKAINSMLGNLDKGLQSAEANKPNDAGEAVGQLMGVATKSMVKSFWPSLLLGAATWLFGCTLMLSVLLNLIAAVKK